MQIQMERSQGQAIIGFKHRAGETVIDDLYQQGSAKVRIVQPEPNRIFETVLINTSGGMTDGDVFDTTINWGHNTTAIVSTQASERYYKSIGSPAKISTRLNIEEKACALWLPQESIMYDGANYKRETIVTLAEGSQMLAVESSIFGRLAMGETINTGKLKESWQVRMNGRLVFADAMGMEGSISQKLDRPMIANGAKAIATIIYAGPDREIYNKKINDIITCNNMTGHATSFDNIVITRLFAPTAYTLRNNIVSLLDVLISGIVPDIGNSTGSLLPRVWSL